MIDLPITKMMVPVKLYRWTCTNPGCGSNFAIILIVPPGQEYDDEGLICHWGNPDSPPYCPSCGSRIDKPAGEAKP